MANFTKEQAKIVESSSKHILVAANAGCGKTTTMIERINHLISIRGVDPKHIMLTSFSRTANQELHSKVEKKLSPYIASQLTIGTLHSICYRILLHNKELLGFSNIELVNESYLTTCVFNLQLQRNLAVFASKGEVSAAVYKFRKNLVSRKEEREEIPPQVLTLLEEAQSQLELSGKLLYDDLMLKAVDLFNNYSREKIAGASSFKHIIVDESQDLSYIQWEVIKGLMDESTSTCCVGDAKQNIFGFRGASYKYLNDFRDLYKSEVYPLSETFRFGKPFAALSNKVIDNLGIDSSYKEYTKTSVPCNTEPAFHFLEKQKQIDFIAEDIVKKVHAGDYSYGDLNVVYRYNKEPFQYMKTFLKRGIPFEVKAGDIFQRAELVFLLKVYHLAREFSLADCIDLLEYYSNDVGDKGLNTIYSSIRFIKSTADFFSQASEVKIKGIGAKKHSAVIDMKSRFTLAEEYLISNASSKVDLIKLAKIMDMQECKFMWEKSDEKGDDPLDVSAERWDYLLFFQEVYNESKHLDLLEWYQDVALDGFKEKEGGKKEDKVQLKTIHGAKGQSLPVVYLLCNRLFDKFFIKTSEQVLDERFALYVATTRAEKEMHLFLEDPYSSRFQFIFPEGWNQELLNKLEGNFRRYSFDMQSNRLAKGVDIVEYNRSTNTLYFYFKDDEKLLAMKGDERLRAFVGQVGYSEGRYYLNTASMDYAYRQRGQDLSIFLD